MLLAIREGLTIWVIGVSKELPSNTVIDRSVSPILKLGLIQTNLYLISDEILSFSLYYFYLSNYDILLSLSF
jgi:hypothetical protein